MRDSQMHKTYSPINHTGLIVTPGSIGTSRSTMSFRLMGASATVTELPITPADLPVQFATLRRLDKIALIARTLSFTATQLGWIVDRGPAAGWYDLTKLPVAPTASTATSSTPSPTSGCCGWRARRSTATPSSGW